MIPPLCTTVPQHLDIPVFVLERVQVQRAPFYVPVEFGAVDLSLFDQIREAKKLEIDDPPRNDLDDDRTRRYESKFPPHPPVRGKPRSVFPDPDCDRGRYLGRRRLPGHLPWHGAMLYDSVSYLIDRQQLPSLAKKFRRAGDVGDSF